MEDLKIIQMPLEKGEFYDEKTVKDTIYLHHTAGGHNPINTISGWENDRSKSGGILAVATSFVIGGLSTSNKDAQYDGVVYQAFPDENWAHHLGTSLAQNTLLNRKSIGIEICNYGPITMTKDGRFLNYVNKEVPAEMVEELPFVFRNFRYYHKYTDKQLESTRKLILTLAAKHGIDFRKGLRDKLNVVGSVISSSFGLQSDAENGMPGIWSHSNIRADKYDVAPTKGMVQMIKSL